VCVVGAVGVSGGSRRGVVGAGVVGWVGSPMLSLCLVFLSLCRQAKRSQRGVWWSQMPLQRVAGRRWQAQAVSGVAAPVASVAVAMQEEEYVSAGAQRARPIRRRRQARGRPARLRAFSMAVCVAPLCVARSSPGGRQRPPARMGQNGRRQRQEQSRRTGTRQVTSIDHSHGHHVYGGRRPVRGTAV